jgi:hypothetical protein
VWSNQIVRWSNEEPDEVRFAAGQAARLLFTPRRIRQVNLYLPASIAEATGAARATFGWMESLTGLHVGKVALITGGSSGSAGRSAACWPSPGRASCSPRAAPRSWSRCARRSSPRSRPSATWVRASACT